MLTLILGRAGTGKTAFAMNDIRMRMDAGQTGLLLIVPEQYSHDAERQLCAVCGDKLSLYGETLSFTRLCGHVFSEAGGAPERILDAGGQILAMHRALESVASRLNVFGAKWLRAELLEKLLDAVKEFKSRNISPDALGQIAEQASNPLRDKLRDLSLIFHAYEALLSARGGDVSDKLALLAGMIGESAVGDAGHVYFDGFNDFTALELRVIEELLKKNAEMTICLTCDPNDDGEVFEITSETARRLQRLAGEYNAGVKIVLKHGDGSSVSLAKLENSTRAAPSKAAELVFLEQHLFGYAAVTFPGQCRAITVCSAPSRYAECEFAASKVLELVRAGYRWRDIGVMARDWEEYGPICENVFEKYGVPFFSGGKADILDKPPAALIDTALEIAVAGWEYKPVFRYLKTGLLGVPADDCAELENYVLKWRIRGSLWTRDWTLPESGYGFDADQTALARLNDLRRRITQPLIRLREKIKAVSEAGAKLEALYAFLEEIGLPQRLRDKAEELERRGEPRLADEYAQLWDVIKLSMEQMPGILGDSRLSAAEFRRLFTLTLSQYEVGVIPVSIDRTALGGMAMNRRRDLKCLIVLGATDSDMPMLAKGAGALSDSEREELARLGADIPSGLEERLNREMNMLYSTLTLPSRELVLTYPTGGGARPSFIVKRIKTMFGIDDIRPREEDYMTAAETPCFEFAALAGHADISPMAAAAREYFGNTGGRFSCIAETTQESSPTVSLSPEAAERLYGRELSLSATRVDKYYSCPFLHFAQSGLGLAPRLPAGFDAPAIGIFMHFVLEGAAREIKAGVGFKNADEKLCKGITARYIEKYVHDVLFDFEGAGARFIYLFRRLGEDVLRIVLDMLDELKRSDFEPLDFELEFSKLPGAEEKSPDGLSLRGVVDRVDGWERGGKIYLRVIDYKSRRKVFDLTDIIHGRNMQMLIYLFALQAFGGARYGAPIEPAGVLYVPMQDVIIKAPRSATEEETAKKRERELRRSGMILDDPFVLEAMEHGGTKKYLPVKLTKDGGLTGDSLVSIDQIAQLSGHVSRMLRRAVGGILGGDIGCSPYYKNDNDNACLYCQYHAVCGFDADAGDRRRFIRKMGADEAWEKLKVER